MESAKKKFQHLLGELFKFDSSDLDFGIYRIMNYKRDVIEKFIKEELPKTIESELSKGRIANQSYTAKEFDTAKEQILQNFGEKAIDPDGNLDEAFLGTPLGKTYLELQAEAAGSQVQEGYESIIFNHLYTFFSRYYQDGDYISKKRYSKRQKYAIPYNGEEVYLHWANNDQYYIKTGEYFHDYTFTSHGIKIHFKMKVADVEQNNVRGKIRFFIPRVKEIEWHENTAELVIPFEYRPLTEYENVTYGTKGQQEKILVEALETIPQNIKKADKSIVALTAERRTTSEGRSVSFLEHHLRQYTRRNTSDFFIHKDLKGFLSREIDFYLKNEVLYLDEMVAVGEKNSEGWFQIMRVIKIVGGRIIDFLDQIEFFQKKLWEKLKFVTETQYCITVERIDEAFYPEIADCEDQWNEWKDLFKLNEEKGAMCSGNLNTKEGRIQILKNNPTLVVDTKYYSQHFSDKLLHNIENLDDITGGVLFNGDNYHVLSLLGTKYNEAVKCIYIDPPFNTENDGFLYKDGYLHSSWLTMMKDRLELAKKLLSNDGTFYAHIDYNEKERLKLLLDTQLVYITEIIWRIGWVSGYKSAAKKFIRNHDTIYQYGKAKSPLFLKTYIQYPEGYTRRDGGEPSGNGYPLEDTWNCNELDQLNSIQIMSFSKEKVGNQALTQKNENLIARMIKSSSNEKDLILDYFLGSGTTTAVAHKLNRKYIGIEMGPQFDTYVLPRMKKVLFGEPYGISSEVSWKGGGVFKYSRVESYEDTLNNIQFDEATGQEVLKFDDYILKYMLKWETKKSETLLNIEKLANPFDYRLGMVEGGKTSEKMVDITETFNYLLGLHVRTRKVYNNKDQRYLVFRGQIDHREVAVIWRNIEDWTKEDLEKDKKFVIEQQLTEGADEVFVNGDSFIPEAKSLDPIFKARMFAEVQ